MINIIINSHLIAYLCLNLNKIFDFSIKIFNLSWVTNIFYILNNSLDYIFKLIEKEKSHLVLIIYLFLNFSTWQLQLHQFIQIHWIYSFIQVLPDTIFKKNFVIMIHYNNEKKKLIFLYINLTDCYFLVFNMEDRLDIMFYNILQYK